MNNRSTTAKICFTALFAALICVATIIIRIPSPLGGYINFGDCILLAGAWFLGAKYGFAAGAVGSALADIFSGYAAYAPATFIIKGVMAVAAALIQKKSHSGVSKAAGAVIAELVMIGGYLVFEVYILGYGGAALANVPYNAIQGAVGVVGGILLSSAMGRISRKNDL